MLPSLLGEETQQALAASALAAVGLLVLAFPNRRRGRWHTLRSAATALVVAVAMCSGASLLAMALYSDAAIACAALVAAFGIGLRVGVAGVAARPRRSPRPELMT